ncbi:MAG: hypothetical protein MJ177_07095 [Clostridia bacterium]|nr:hypothetical protein [Clostridia bacterium]
MGENRNGILDAGTRIKEAVCIDTNRIYDSCADKDCLADLRVLFTSSSQSIIDSASSIRCRGCEILNAMVNVESVPFNRGCYSVDITYYFRLYFDVVTSPAAAPCTVSGLTGFNKKCILYGSEGNVRVFTSEMSSDGNTCHTKMTGTAPRAKVQVVDPICLDAKICTFRDCCSTCCESCVPEHIARLYDSELIVPTAGKAVKVTLGLFSIVQLERDVQMTIPAYDFCMPAKECTVDAEDPCDAFRKINFPVNEFFPPNCKSGK